MYVSSYIARRGVACGSHFFTSELTPKIRRKHGILRTYNFCEIDNVNQKILRGSFLRTSNAMCDYIMLIPTTKNLPCHPHGFFFLQLETNSEKFKNYSKSSYAEEKTAFVVRKTEFRILKVFSRVCKKLRIISV